MLHDTNVRYRNVARGSGERKLFRFFFCEKWSCQGFYHLALCVRSMCDQTNCMRVFRCVCCSFPLINVSAHYCPISDIAL